VVEVSTTGGGIARFFDFQNRRFSAVVCERCKFTEFYRTRASVLSKVFDLMGSG
jgi:predicted nucleic-acid-binding Zn-ribbon protein